VSFAEQLSRVFWRVVVAVWLLAIAVQVWSAIGDWLL
jgi:hypothetical protein